MQVLDLGYSGVGYSPPFSIACIYPCRGKEVYARNFGTGNTWVPGEIAGPESIMVKCSDGKLIRRCQDHLRCRKDDQPNQATTE